MKQYQDDYYDDYEEERPRHRKAVISKKEKSKKADHKHQYAKCLVAYVAEDMFGKRSNRISAAKYCTICGKLDCNWNKSIPAETADFNGSIPVIEVEMWDKAVNL